MRIKSFPFSLKAVAVHILLILMVCCTKTNSSDPEKVIRIGTNATFAPFEIVNSKNELEGFDIDLGYEIGKKLGLKVEFVELDFDALIMSLKTNKIDLAISGLSITESRRKEMIMVPYQGEPLNKVSFVFWARDTNAFNSIDDIRKVSEETSLPVSVQAGHFLEGFLLKNKFNVKPLGSPPEQVIDVKYGKSLAAVVDQANGQEIEKTSSDVKIKTLDLPREDWDLGYGIGIKKENTAMEEKILSVIGTLKKEGFIKSLEEKWLKGSAVNG